MEKGNVPGRHEAKASHPNYILLLLVVVAFLNYIDRQVIYIVGERVKADLHLTDSQLGFLMGTSFAVFYGVCGIGMGRIADALSRTKLLAVGLVVWSGLTALSGAAANYAMLAIARAGVGIGESVASPCSQALLAEHFPQEKRARAFSVYVVGVHLGSAASLLMGAVVLQHWNAICTWFPGNACAIADWRAAFLAVGLPGVVMAFLVYRLKEAPREKSSPSEPVRKTVLREMSAAVPPLTLWNLHAAGGRRAVIRNLVLIACIVVIVALLIRLTGDLAQWLAVSIGAYAILTWGQAMKLRDRELYDQTFGGAAFVAIMAAGALQTVYIGAIGAWVAPYAMRVLGVQPVTAGLYLGIAAAFGGALGVMAGGTLTDWWKKRDDRAPVWVAIVALVTSIPFVLVMMMAGDFTTFAIANLMFQFTSQFFGGVAGATIQDIVAPRMRASAAGSFGLVMMVVAIALGPYTVGKISELTGSLQTGMLSMLAVAPFSIAVFVVAARRLRERHRELAAETGS